VVVVYNSKLTRALIGAKRDVLSDKPYAFSAKEREVFKEYERIATGRNRKVWSYAERAEALNQLYNDNKQYLSKNALNSLRGMNSEFSKQIGKRKVSDRDSVNRYLADLTVGANSDYFDIGKEKKIELAEPITPVNRLAPQKKGFFDKIFGELGEYVNAIGTYALGAGKRAALPVTAGLLLLANTALFSPPNMPANYLFAEEPAKPAEEPAQPKKVITVENKEPEEKTEPETQPKVPADTSVITPTTTPTPVATPTKWDFGTQLYKPLDIYRTPSLRFDVTGGDRYCGARTFGSFNFPEERDEKPGKIVEPAWYRPKNLFLSVDFGEDSKNDSLAQTYNRSDYSYLIGSENKLGYWYVNSGRDRMHDKTETTSDATTQTVVKRYDGFANRLDLSENNTLTFQYNKSRTPPGKNATKVSILQPIQLTVNTDVDVSEEEARVDWDHRAGENVSYRIFADGASANAKAKVDGEEKLNETWRTLQSGASLYKCKNDVSWYVGADYTGGKDVTYRLGGDALLLEPLGKGWRGGLTAGTRDGMWRGSLVATTATTADAADHYRFLVDLPNNIALTDRQQNIAKFDTQKCFARKGRTFDIGYEKQPHGKGTLTGFGAIPLSERWSIAGYGEKNAYGTFTQYAPGENNRLSFDFGIGRMNPDNDKGSWTVNAGLTIWLGSAEKKDGKDAKK